MKWNKSLDFVLSFPGFPDQADHSLTIVWRHTNHTKFLIWSCHDQLGNHIWSRLWSAWNHTPVWPRLWSAWSHEWTRLWLAWNHKLTRLWLARHHKWTSLWSACSLNSDICPKPSKVFVRICFCPWDGGSKLHFRSRIVRGAILIGSLVF